MSYFYSYKMKLLKGTIYIVEEGESIVQVFLQRVDQMESGSSKGANAGVGKSVRKETQLIHRTAQELYEYMQGKRINFDIPLSPVGTEFQQRVWSALREIPHGVTKSYGEIAEVTGSPKGARAVGMACNRNPILILIPCHRVVGATGALTGYGGGIDLKEYLLQLERQENFGGFPRKLSRRCLF